MTYWLTEMLRTAPKVPPDNAKCIFGCKEAAVGLFSLPNGCVCHKEIEQYLCVQHAIKSTPIAGFDIIHAYEAAA